MTTLAPRTLEMPSDVEALFDKLYDMGVTDGFPVIPPTDERVERFIRAAGLPGSKEIALVPPLNGSATVEKIAVNAVMAGCRAEYMPVLVAAVDAMAAPEFNWLGIQTTTNPVCPLLLINGPIRQRLDVNCGRSALGPGRRANATIGRAVRLIMLNVGGAVPGEVDKATLGMPGKYTLCLGELEEESPWPGLHVDRGCQPGESAVTVVGVQGTQNMFIPWKQADSIVTGLAGSIASLAANNTLLGHGQTIMFINPGHARILAEQGYDKKRIQRELYERSGIPASALPTETSGVTEGYRKMVDGRNMITRDPEDILIAVAGGPEAYHITWCESFGESAVTRAIREP